MKKLLILPIVSIMLFGCSNSNNNATSKSTLKRPNDTNLEYWITERVTTEQLEKDGCTFLPGWMGADEYLGSKYQLNEDGTIPDIHVTYLITGFPDLLDDPAITKISITDPEVTVYGLKIGAKDTDVFNRASRIENATMGYATGIEECCPFIKVQDCSFVFGTTSIEISVPVTNNQGIIY